jgi:hypothetical protein
MATRYLWYEETMVLSRLWWMLVSDYRWHQGRAAPQVRCGVAAAQSATQSCDGRRTVRALRSCGFALAAVVLSAASQSERWTRAQALAAVAQPDPAVRVAGVERLAEVGLMVDADRLLSRLGDIDPRVRVAAESAVWSIWSRSGDPEVDKLFVQGLHQMRTAALDDA